MMDFTFDATYPDRGPLPWQGRDTLIAVIPPHLALVLPLAELRAFALNLGEHCAQHIGEYLHHATFVITGSPDTVRTAGLLEEHATCQECLDGVAAGVAYLTEHPAETVIVGTLHWVNLDERNGPLSSRRLTGADLQENLSSPPISP
jgi:hypothetical protein